MKREADYTIKGFLYQFNKTLQQVISEPEGTEITVEGIIEDIDVESPNGIRAIQCKYHETKENYRLSDISKPILQMLVHYSKNIDKNIQYVLYAHFSKEEFGEKNLSTEDLNTILSTKNKQYIANYISQIKPPIDPGINTLISKLKKTTSDLIKISEYYNLTKGLSLTIDIADFNKPEKFKFILGKPYDVLIDDTKKNDTKKM